MQPKKQLEVQYIGIYEEIDTSYWPKMHFLKKGQKIRASVEHPLIRAMSERKRFFNWCLPLLTLSSISIDDLVLKFTFVEWFYDYWRILLIMIVFTHIIENQHRRLGSFLVSVEDGREVAIKVSQACGNHHDNSDNYDQYEDCLSRRWSQIQ